MTLGKGLLKHMSLDLNLRSIAACAVLVGASAAFTSCASTKQSVGLENVDSLVSRVEQVLSLIHISEPTRPY